ncbi:hypothetical protein SDD15_004558 [Salmonella enterica]|nr:hypothetical protein [Salmonella enterica]
MDKKKNDLRLSVLSMVVMTVAMYTVPASGQETTPSGVLAAAEDTTMTSSSLPAAENNPSQPTEGEHPVSNGQVILSNPAPLPLKENTDEAEHHTGTISQSELTPSGLSESGTLQSTLEHKLGLSVEETSRLRETLAALKERLRMAESAENEKMAEQQKQITELSESRHALQQELAVTLSRLRSAGQEKDPPEQLARNGGNSAEAERDNLEDKMATVERQLNTLTAEWDQIKLLSGAAEKAEIAPTSEVRRPELRTEAEKQAYASGVVFSRDLARMRAVHQDLGVNLSRELMLAGIIDGVNNTLLLDEQALRDSHRALAAQLASLEKEKYDAGVKQLEKMTAKSTILKRNQSMFFVQHRKGNGAVRAGNTVTFDLTESVVDGKTLRTEKGVTAVTDDSLPYIVQQALTLAGRGGEINVYCMVSDVYPSGNIPEGLYPYTLLKYNVKVSMKIKK